MHLAILLYFINIMNKTNKHIEIVCTNRARAAGMSKATLAMVYSVLSKKYRKVGISFVDGLQDIDELILKAPDLIMAGVSMVRTDPSESLVPSNVWLSEYLDEHNINYTGSHKSAIRISVNKELAKTTAALAGLQTSPYFTALPGQYGPQAKLMIDYPLFIKPIASGGSKGIDKDSVVHNYSSFCDKVESIYARFATKALVEPYLTGREFSVAILGNGGDALVMPVELITVKNCRGDRILCKDVKTEDTEEVIAIGDAFLEEELKRLAKRIFVALGARDYGRIDFRMDAHGQLHFLEANLAPGLGGGYFTRACRLNCQLDYESVILTIAKLGLSHATSKATKVAAL